MKIEVWGTGKPLEGFTQDAVLTSARKLFPTKKSQHIARFIAGKRFLITRVNDEAGAQKLIEGLAKSGIQADTKGPPPAVTEDGVEEIDALEPDDEALPVLDEDEDGSAPAEPSPPPRRAAPKTGLVIAIAALVIVAIGAGFAFMRYQSGEARRSAEQAQMEAKTRAALAARRDAEAAAKKQAADEAAEKANAAAQEALRQEKREAAVSDVTNAFAAGRYPEVIAMSERFDLMYGLDPRVTKLEQEATFTLKEGARRGNFAAILDAPIKGSTRYDALRQWALQVQERAKPQR